MTTGKPRITDSRCVLAVKNLEMSTKFYMDVLGFTRDFGDGTDGWSFLSRDGFRVMLGECPDAIPAGELGDHNWYVYLTVENVDAFYDSVAGAAEILAKPQSKPWGMRDFTLRTPDGHRIVFGEPV